MEFFRENLNSTFDLDSRINEAAASMPFLPVVDLRRNVQESRLTDLTSAVQKILEALENAMELCDASIQTRNPIRMLW